MLKAETVFKNMLTRRALLRAFAFQFNKRLANASSSTFF